jgi:hypothetical protein
MTDWNKGLTLARHREIGKDLYQMRNKLASLALEVGNAYPLISGIYNSASDAVNALDTLRSRLDAQLFEEHREIGTRELTRVYYPDHEASNEDVDPR